MARPLSPEKATPDTDHEAGRRARRRPSGGEVAPAQAAVHEVGGVELLVLSLPAETDPWSKLTPAERRVAEYAAQGRTNPEIAALRKTSVRTVANQLASIFRKLSVDSRLALAAHLLEAALPEKDADGEG